MYSKSRLLLVAVSLVVLGSVAVGAQARPNQTTHLSHASAQIKASFACSGNAVPIFKQVCDGVKRAAKTANVKLKNYDNNFDGPTTLNNARLMVQDKPNLIVEYNLTQNVGPAVSKVITDSHIPCIGLNAPTKGCPFINLSERYIGTTTGQTVAKFAQAKGWNASNTVVLLLGLAGGGADLEDSVAYFYLTAAPVLGLPTVNRSDITDSSTNVNPNLYQVDGKAALEPAYQATKNILQAIPKSKNLIVFGVNDDSALGAWRAISEDGRGSQTLIAGLGVTPGGLQQLRTNPQWVANADVFLDYWGEFTIAMGQAILHHAKPPALTLFPMTILTKKNVGQYYKPGQTRAYKLPPLAKTDRYLAPYLRQYGNITGLK